MSRARLAFDLSAFAVVFVCFVLFSGCVPSRGKAKAPAATVTAGDVAFAQTGDAAAPATVTTDTQRTSITLPAGTLVFVDKVLGLVYRLGVDTPIFTETRRVSITGPKAFTPPAAPTPSEEAAGIAAQWFWALLVGGVALAALGIWWRGKWVIIGGAIAAGAGAFGLFVQSNPWVLTVAGVGVLIAAGGFLAWHLWLKPKQPGQTLLNFFPA
jgi:hypothetical protein